MRQINGVQFQDQTAMEPQDLLKPLEAAGPLSFCMHAEGKRSQIETLDAMQTKNWMHDLLKI